MGTPKSKEEENLFTEDLKAILEFAQYWFLQAIKLPRSAQNLATFLKKKQILIGLGIV